MADARRCGVTYRASALEPTDDGPVFRRRRALAIALTWLSYTTYYLGRKPFAVSKSRIGHELGLGAPSLAAIDTGYLVAYAVGQFASGVLGDRFGARRLIGFGMLASAGALAWFGASHTALFLMIAFTLNGLTQATGWPGNIKALAGWTTSANRGAIMGIWCTAGQVGGLLATMLATLLLGLAGWRTSFFVPAVALAAVGLAVLLFLPEPLAPPRDETDRAARRAATREAFRTVVRSPAVWTFGASFFFIKIIRYCLLFWLPFYLHRVLGFSEGTAGYLSTSFEIGGIFGTVLFGVASDRFRRFPRAVFASAGLLALAGALGLYSAASHHGPLANFAAMTLVGVLLFGPDNLIAGAIGQELGGRDAASTAVGIINGVGSTGAALQGAFTVWISHRYGWNALFQALPALAIGASVLALLGRRLAATGR